YSWSVRAVDSLGNHSLPTPIWTGTINGAAAPVVNLFIISTPTLSWTAVAGVTGYETQVDNRSTFNAPEYDNASLAPGALSQTVNPLADGVYYWRVRAKLA